jgi:hypothetical protein
MELQFLIFFFQKRIWNMVWRIDSFLKNVLCCKIIGTLNLGMIKSHFFSNKCMDLTIFET